MESKIAAITLLAVFGLVSAAAAEMCAGCKSPVAEAMVPVASLLLRTSLLKPETIPNGVEGEKVKLVKINHATYQVVAGLNFEFDFDGEGEKTGKLYSCRMAVLEQAWRMKTEVTYYSCQPKTVRAARSLPGGKKEVDLSGKPEEAALLKSLVEKELNKGLSLNDNLRTVVSVGPVTKQVVSGLYYEVTLEVAETNCKVGTVASLEGCAVQEQGHEVCKFELWLKAHGTDQVSQLDCHSKA